MRKSEQFFFPLFFSLFLFCCQFAHGQQGFVYNFNINNGLQSNHIYGVLKDRFGYLWVYTDKGIAKYNGYEFKSFNLSDGLPNVDIWDLFEDRKGRIWLSSISEEIGYLYNDKYHKPFLKEINNTVYPSGIRNWEHGIIFSSPYLNGDAQPTICLEKNDTIIKYFDPAKALNHNGPKLSMCREWTFHYIDMNGRAVFVKDTGIYELTMQGNSSKLVLISTLKDTTFLKILSGGTTFAINKFLVSYSLGFSLTQFYILNMETGTTDSMDISKYDSKGPYHLILTKGKTKINSFYAVTNSNIIEFECGRNGVRYVTQYPIKDIVTDSSVKGSNVNTLYQDNFWGYALCTNSKGLYIQNIEQNRLRKEEKIDLLNYICVGVTGNCAFWWNNAQKILAKSDANFRVSYHKLENAQSINSVVRFSGDTLMVLGGNSFFINGNTYNVISKNILNDGTFAGMIDKDNSLVNISLHSFSSINFRNATQPVYSVFDRDRFKYLIYDSLRQTFWAYNDGKVHLHSTIKETVFLKEQLLQFGVRKIEKIVIDNKFGNIFFKGSRNGEAIVTMYNPNANQYTALYKNFNLNGTSIYVHNNTVVTIGRFGIIFSKITGLGQLSNPVFYKNAKNFNYKFVYDAQFSNDKILLNTDNGVYTASMPTDAEMLSASVANHTNYKFILNYRDTVYNIGDNDTVIIDQKKTRLQFDVINPTGNGKTRYSYSITPGDSVWHELNSNELTLSQTIKPGAYYHLYIRASDNVWVSNNVDICFYIQPYWWQVLLLSKWFWVYCFVFILALVALIVYISYWIITKNQVKRNLRLELELKSVYAQINPHFIFNTIGTAMFFVKEEKMSDAYSHLAKFSKLLRAYIKSARSKYITIQTEIENLDNYIHLQQVRFEDKFDYEIITDEGLDVNYVKIPSLLLQPIVENAISHGLFHKEEKGHLKIEFKKMQQPDEINIVIDDDGIGRKKAKLIAQNSLIKTESFGESLIEDLVAIFNKYEKINISIKYIDKEEPISGTTVVIAIKYNI